MGCYINSNNIKLIEIDGPYGDSSYKYAVQFDKPLTLGGFFDFVGQDRYGTVTDISISYGHSEITVKFKNGKMIEASHNINDLIGKEIESITGNGGWELFIYNVIIPKPGDVTVKTTFVKRK